jgi:hypothetical protein
MAKADRASFLEFLKAIWNGWWTAMSGPLSVPATLIAVAPLHTWLAENYVPTAQTLAMATAFICAWATGYLVWKKERIRLLELEDRLTCKIRLSLKYDPTGMTTGIEIGKDQNEGDAPYIQVCAEPANDSTIYEARASITNIEHRSNDASGYTVITSEPSPTEWSREGITTTLSKGKISRLNIARYSPTENLMGDVVPKPSFKVSQFYQKTGKVGQYRYRVHVEGRDTTPVQAYVSVKWLPRGYPKIELEPVE